MNTERPDHDDESTGTAEEVPDEGKTSKPEASGSGSQAGSETGAKGGAQPEAGSGPRSEPEPEVRCGSESGAEPEAQSGSGAQFGAEPEGHSKPEPKGQTGSEPAAEAGSKAEARPEPKPRSERVAGSGSMAGAGRGVKSGAEAGSESASGTGDAVTQASKGAKEAHGPDGAKVSESPQGLVAAETPQGPGAAQVPQEPEGSVGSDEAPQVPETPEPPYVPHVPEGADAPETPQVPEVPKPSRVSEVPDVTGASEHDGHPGGRRARGRSPVVIASVAAAVLLVGGGGVVLAADPGGRTGGAAAPGGHGTPRPLVLDGYSAPGAGAGDGGTNGIAPGEPNPYGTTYRVTGPLPDGPGSAPVYRARGEVTRDEVAKLAEALGVDGTPVADAQAWRVGSGKDGSGPVLRVERTAPGSWMFSRYAPGTDDCKGALCGHDPAAPPVHPVSAAAALKAAAPVLKALGQDDAKVDAAQIMGDQRVVNADPLVGGLPTYGWTTGLSIGRQGELIGGSGQLKAPVKGDTYPVLSARRTLDLMNTAPRADHRMGIGGCASPVPHKDRLEAPCGTSGSDPATKAPAPENAVTIGKAVFGLAAHSSGGQRMLVPSWLFEVQAPAGQGARTTVTYPAVAPEYLTSSAPPSGQSGPEPRGSDGARVTRDVKVTGYSTEGEELTVRFEGGVCADYRASARESSDRVTVTVTETAWSDKVCILIAKVYHRTVHLDRPLGDRKVVGTDGQAIPLERPGARLPGAPSLAR
ncbi:hypothetical protein [Streptomyces sp. NPDC055692]|uniref:hypothetical protein n=1 Tax=Streptomyces sp. NPDC055692 TaxID=3155683 RepID=UPI00343C1A10